MKKILITGANSYIGTSFEKYLKENYPDDYIVDTVDMKDGAWREKSFAGYDSVFHVAGIAHQKETAENAHMYYAVNRDLAIETAKKAKTDGVKHFVFLSSMSVYGIESGVITRETRLTPKSHYGKSKAEAEQLIGELSDEFFAVAFVRPPMVYGYGCKGNFQTVVKIVKKLPVFPKVNNSRSMIFIETLCEYVRRYIDESAIGVKLPQNNEYMNTSDMASAIAQKLGKKIFLSSVLGFFVKLLCPCFSVANKAFGSLVYEREEAQFEQKTNSESVFESV